MRGLYHCGIGEQVCLRTSGFLAAVGAAAPGAVVGAADQRAVALVVGVAVALALSAEAGDALAAVARPPAALAAEPVGAANELTRAVAVPLAILAAL